MTYIYLSSQWSRNILEVARSNYLFSYLLIYFSTEIHIYLAPYILYIYFSSRYSIVGDCRGLGLCQALEIVGSKSRKIPSPKLAKEVGFNILLEMVLCPGLGLQTLNIHFHTFLYIFIICTTSFSFFFITIIMYE